MNIKKITDLYKSKRMTQEELASLAGISKTGLNQILLGESNPRISSIESIAKVLKVPVGYFFDDDPDYIKSINQVANGDGNKQNIEIDQQYKKIMRLEFQVDLLKNEIKGLKNELDAKNKIIKLLEKTNK